MQFPQFLAETSMTSYQPATAIDPLHGFVGALVAGDASQTVDAGLQPLGSGFFIAPFLVLTARHVLDEVTAQFHGCTAPEIVGDMRFGLDFSTKHPRHGHMIWAVMGYAYTPTIDVVGLWVQLRFPSELPADFRWDLPTLSMSQVVAGQEIGAFGFPHSTHRLDQDGRSIVGLNAHKSSGAISEVYELRRESVMLTYPCFQASLTTTAGMSGGPVFDAKGHVVGLVGTSMDFGHGSDPEVSFITSIWPVAGLSLDHTASEAGVAKLPVDQETGLPTAGYPLQRLIDSGVVRADPRHTRVDELGTVTLLLPSTAQSS